MAELSSGQVRAIARLARLRVDDGEIHELSRQLGRILDAFSVLAATDVDGVEPTTGMAEAGGGEGGNPPTPLRADRPAPCLSRRNALEQAPDAAEGHFRVPRVLA